MAETAVMQAKGVRILSCDECEETCHPDPPPCEQCDRPTLMSANREAFRIWVICNHHGRPASFAGMLPITIDSAVTAAELLGSSGDDVLKAMAFDREYVARYHELKKEEDDNG